MSATAWGSYWTLCLIQAALVLAPRAVRPRFLARLRAHWPAVLLPVAAAVGLTFIPAVAEALGGGLSTLALAAVPPLAALGAGWALRGGRPWLGALVVPIAAVAWASPGSDGGKTAALLLVALSCVALGTIVAGILPSAIAKVGILVWAAVDLSIALAHDLARASRAITEATPVLGPQLRHLGLEEIQLQRVVVGTASMEYADLFLAAGLGAVLALEGRRRGGAALVVALAAVALSAFFLVTDVLPATVPVAMALVVEELRRRRAGVRERRRDEPLRGVRRAA